MKVKGKTIFLLSLKTAAKRKKGNVRSRAAISVLIINFSTHACLSRQLVRQTVVSIDSFHGLRRKSAEQSERRALSKV